MDNKTIYQIYNDILDNVVNIIQKNRPGGIPQHILLSGDEESGKSTLLNRVKESAENNGIKVVQLSFPYILVSIQDVISNFQKNNTSTTLLLVDDFHLLMGKLSVNEQYSLRAFLFSNGAPMLIGTINRDTAAITDYKAPFFDAFRIFVLHPENFTGAFFPPEVYSRLKNEDVWDTVNKIICNNFNYAKQFALNYSDGMTVEDSISMLLKANERYFKLLFLSLPNIQQQVVLGIAMSTSEPGLSEIRKSAKIESTSITSSLKRLISQSIVKQIGQKKRNYTYTLSDELFCLWCKKNIISC